MSKMAYFLIAAVIIAGLAMAQEAKPQQDLTISGITIEPEPQGLASPRMILHGSRSYRLTVTIRKNLNLPAGKSFLVKTECIRNGERVTIGELRVGDSRGWNIYACYDLYPAEAGLGDCILETTVDIHNEIAETDESAASNVWSRGATIQE